MNRCLTYAISALLAATAFARSAQGDDNSPLIVLQMSEETLNQALEETIERESEVDTVMLETHVVGTARSTGRPKLRLVECDAGPTLKAIYSGTSVSHTQGYRPPVVIHSRTQTDFTIEKLIAVDQLGDVMPHPTNVHATTDVVTENITTHRRGLLGRIVLRRAWREVAAKRGQTIALAQARAKQRLATAFDDALQTRIAKMQTQMPVQNLTAALLPAGATPATRSATKGGYLTTAVFARSPAEKVVDIRLPTLPVKAQPIQIWVHKSLVGENLSAAGRNVFAIRQWLALPSLPAIPFLTTGVDAPSGPSWLTVDDWFVVQLSGAPK